jgi:Phytanoyl-CoA dioxygenase (PhyH)
MSPMSRLKMQVAELLWTVPRSQPFRAAIGELAEQFVRDGCCVVENFLDDASVERLAAHAARVYLDERQYVVQESNGSDERIYGVDRVCPVFAMEEEMKAIDAAARAFYWPLPPVWFQLLGRITCQPGNAGSGSGWHRDSPFSHQFKALIYLSDVHDHNGPFQFIKGSHLKRSVLDVSRYLGTPLTQYRFSAEQLDRVVQAGVVSAPMTITGAKGTMLLADTRGLHRGKPLAAGARLAVTRYYFSRAVPRHFTEQYALTGRPHA